MEEGKEMYQDSKHAYTAIVLLIKPFVSWHSRRRRRRRRRRRHRRRRGLSKLPSDVNRADIKSSQSSGPEFESFLATELFCFTVAPSSNCFEPRL